MWNFKRNKIRDRKRERTKEKNGKNQRGVAELEEVSETVCKKP